MNTKTKKIHSTVKNIFKKHRLSSIHAKICADALINAELVGAPSHGLSRLKMYCDRINKKVINPRPKIKIKKISQSISHIDADDSIGFVAADIAIKKAIESAKKTGIGLVAVKNSGHYGLSGYYDQNLAPSSMGLLLPLGCICKNLGIGYQLPSPNTLTGKCKAPRSRFTLRSRRPRRWNRTSKSSPCSRWCTTWWSPWSSSR